MRTIEQAERECREAWLKTPSDYGWCIHHKIEMERLTEPIGNRISFIINNKVPEEIIARLDNLRPVMSGRAIAAEKAYQEAIAPARKAYQEATVLVWKARQEATVLVWKAYEEAIAPAWKACQEAIALAWKAYNEATVLAEKAFQGATVAPAWKAFQEIIALAHAEDVPGHTWNGKSIF